MEITVLVDLGYGDSGKGSIVNYLAREKSTLNVRWSGGSQCAHHVVTENNVTVRFSQIGSASIKEHDDTSTTRTLHLTGSLIDPVSLQHEQLTLKELEETDKCKHNVYPTVIASPSCELITVYHKLLNIALNKRHNSCGHGIGITRELSLNRGFSLTFNDFIKSDEHQLYHKFCVLRDICLQILIDNKVDPLSSKFLAISQFPTDVAYQTLFNAIRYNSSLILPSAGMFASNSNYLLENIRSFNQIIFEPAQGILIDQYYGTDSQYTRTYTDVTAARVIGLLSGIHRVSSFNERLQCINADYRGKNNQISADDFQNYKYYGITRAYSTRHGDGLFYTENAELDELIYEDNNTYNNYQGKFRIGYLNLNELQYAVKVAQLDRKLDGIILTCVDKIENLPNEHKKVLDGIKYVNYTTLDELISIIENKLQMKVVLTSHGPKASQKSWR